MPAPIHPIIITPVGSIPLVQGALGITPTSPVFTEADVAPRAITHRSRSGSVTADQRAIIDEHLAGEVNPALADSIIHLWNRADPENPYANLLQANGLTLVRDPDNP